MISEANDTAFTSMLIAANSFFTFYVNSKKGPDKRIGQRRSPDAEKVTHIKGRILFQALILYNYVPFQIGTSHM